MNAPLVEFEPTGTDNGDWQNPDDIVIPSQLPVPWGWRILVMPVQPRKQTASGIVIPTIAQDNEGHLQIVGKVAALGPLAYRAWKYASSLTDYLRILLGQRVSWAPKVGDWVLYGRYTGQRVEYKNLRLILMNDDELSADIHSPEGVRVS